MEILVYILSTIAVGMIILSIIFANLLILWVVYKIITMPQDVWNAKCKQLIRYIKRD